ncbi:MAG: hypothetical protein LAP13_26340, partial [Acidobacteriia bacterium]|nr:hypothetical protein [Terriglobia bacterium]
PNVQAQFAPWDLSHLDGNPDFPALVLARLREGTPHFLLIVVDARNGKASQKPTTRTVIVALRPVIAPPVTSY